MKRINHTLLFATIVMVSVSGCSGGKLRNLLSRNDYQTLEEQNATQLGLPNGSKTQVVSAETEEDKSFFKLPGFLKSDDESSVIAPDPFIGDSQTTSAEDKIAAYKAKVDQRIARQKESVKSTLSDVERQAEDLFKRSKDTGENVFAAFADSTSADEPSVANSESQASVTNNGSDNTFAEMFGQQDQVEKPEIASPLIADNSSSPFAVKQPAQSEMSEFDKLLQAHQEHTPESAGEIVIAPSKPEADLFAELDKPQPEAPKAADFFGDQLAKKDTASSSVFDNLMNDSQTTEDAGDIWGQLDRNDSVANRADTNDVFTAAIDNQQAESAFGTDFQQTAAQHGFTDRSSTWGSVVTETEPALTVLNTPAELEQDNPPLMASFDSTSDLVESAGSDPFFPASQSQSTNSNQSDLGGQGMGLIIPASDSSSTDFFNLDQEATGVQQISGTQANSTLTTVATNHSELDLNLFDDAEASPAVQTPTTSSGWTNRTWFLIIGCVLIAGLLFLPERQKR